MPGCHESRSAARLPFMVTPYSAEPGGEFVPARPDVCPRSEQDLRPCVISLDHVRKRSTGPCIELTVLRCRTHRLGFTLYPPGYVPFGRQRLALVAPDGHVIELEVAGVEAFTDTLFGAALDASKRTQWTRARKGGSDRWWSTQMRRVDAAVQVCGVAPDLEASVREAMAQALRVETLLLRDGADAIARRPGYWHRGQAVRAVLERVLSGPCVLERLLVSGFLAGRWGAPLMWNPATARLRKLPFRHVGTGPPRRLT